MGVFLPCIIRVLEHPEPPEPSPAPCGLCSCPRGWRKALALSYTRGFPSPTKLRQ